MEFALDLDRNVTFQELLVESKEQLWKLDEVLPKDTSLDFSHPLLPDSLTGLTAASFLEPGDRLLLNQITGKSYLNLFCFVEEYIIRDVQRMEGEADERSGEKGALGQFVAEEVKHQALFRRYIDAFDRDFGTETDVLDFADDVADLILSHSPLAILLTTFHLEVITQEHYLKAVEPAETIEPHMVSILKHHWMDEARHAAIDYLEIRRLCSELTPEARAAGLEQYLGIVDAFFELLSMQASHDIGALTDICGDRIAGHEYRRLQFLQHRAYSKIFLGLGIGHPVFRRLVDEILPGKTNDLDRLAEKVLMDEAGDVAHV